VKQRDTWVEARVLCKDWAKRVDTWAEAEEHKDLVQALCTWVVTLVVETRHDTCCCDLSEEFVHSRVLA
jgi:hypothetical protein